MFYTIKAMIYRGEESGFVAECVELPVVTQGTTFDEVIRNLREAIATHLEGEDWRELGFVANPPNRRGFPHNTAVEQHRTLFP